MSLAALCRGGGRGGVRFRKPRRCPIKRSETRFATAADGTRVAYQVVGSGPGDIVYVPAWVTHVELNWKDPARAAFLRRLADNTRVTVFDKRGTGLSDRLGWVPDLEDLVEDMRAVMDACEIERAVLFGVSSGAGMAALFAATYPQRVRGLVMCLPKARARWAADYPWGMQPEDFEQELALIRAGWETGEFVRSYAAAIFTPSRVGDEGALGRMVTFTQAACSMEDALALSEMWWDIDYRAILPSVCVPTLLIGSSEAADEIDRIARSIPGAAQVLVPGVHATGWIGESDAVADALESFISDIGDEEADLGRVLATVLFTDIVDSTAHAAELGDRRWISIRDEHDRTVRSHLARFHGREIKTMGDGFLATFDGPARAVRCALAMVEAVRRLGIDLRAGLHIGEVTRTEQDVSGITVATGARVMAAAGPAEVLVSQTVRDLVAGSGLAFEETGEHSLKGVPGVWQLYRAIRANTARPLTRAPQAT